MPVTCLSHILFSLPFTLLLFLIPFSYFLPGFILILSLLCFVFATGYQRVRQVQHRTHTHTHMYTEHTQQIRDQRTHIENTEAFSLPFASSHIHLDSRQMCLHTTRSAFPSLCTRYFSFLSHPLSLSLSLQMDTH